MTRLNYFYWKSIIDEAASATIARLSPETKAEFARSFFGHSDISSLRIYLTGDASGNDDLELFDGDWYFFSIVGYHLGERWDAWQYQHCLRFRGMAHWTSLPPDARKLLPDIIAKRPFDFAYVCIVHRDLYSKSQIFHHLSHKLRPPARHEKTSELWGEFTASLVAGIHHTWAKFIAQNMGIRSIPLASFVTSISLNKRANANSEDHVRWWVNPIFNGPINFVAGGRPYIDLADGLCWSTRQLICKDTTRYLPPDLPAGMSFVFPSADGHMRFFRSAKAAKDFSELIKKTHAKFDFGDFPQVEQTMRFSRSNDDWRKWHPRLELPPDHPMLNP